MAMPKVTLSLSHNPPPKPQAHPTFPSSTDAIHTLISRRSLILTAFTSSSLVTTLSSAAALPEQPLPQSSSNFLSGIANTRSWFQFYGDGFAIRVPPDFDDINEPEDYNAGLSLYGDKAKPKPFAARFTSPDGVPEVYHSNGAFIRDVISGDTFKSKQLLGTSYGSERSEVLSVVVQPSNSLKITFLEAKDIADLGSLKEVARIFVPGGAKLYSARTIKIKEDEGYRNYYFYEFGNDEQHAALVAAVNRGKAIIAGASAPQNKWDDDGVRLRSAAVSLMLL